MTETQSDGLLLLGLQTTGNSSRLSRLFQARMREVGLHAAVPDLRRTAIGSVVRRGMPLSHIGAYFGLSKAAMRDRLVSTPEGFDREISAFLEEEFAAPIP